MITRIWIIGVSEASGGAEAAEWLTNAVEDMQTQSLAVRYNASVTRGRAARSAQAECLHTAPALAWFAGSGCQHVGAFQEGSFHYRSSMSQCKLQAHLSKPLPSSPGHHPVPQDQSCCRPLGRDRRRHRLHGSPQAAAGPHLGICSLGNISGLLIIYVNMKFPGASNCTFRCVGLG